MQLQNICYKPGELWPWEETRRGPWKMRVFNESLQVWQVYDDLCGIHVYFQTIVCYTWRHIIVLCLHVTSKPWPGHTGVWYGPHLNIINKYNIKITVNQQNQIWKGKIELLHLYICTLWGSCGTHKKQVAELKPTELFFCRKIST